MSGIRAIDENGEQTEHCFQLGGDPRDLQSRAPIVEQLDKTQPVRPTKAHPVAQPSSLSAPQLIKQLRARLRVVEREIKARQKLENERNQIKRLLSAAITERDNVRRLRSA